MITQSGQATLIAEDHVFSGLCSIARTRVVYVIYIMGLCALSAQTGQLFIMYTVYTIVCVAVKYSGS